MPLTPSDVEQTTFSTALRGYDLDEVDDFLDQVVVAIRDLQDEVAGAKARAADLDRNGGGSGTVIADESAVGRALVAAQEAADRLLEDARTEASVILGSATSEAEAHEVERQRRRVEAEAEMAEHAARIADVRQQLALLATQVADKLDEMDAVIADGAEEEEGNGHDSGAGESIDSEEEDEDLDDQADGESPDQTDEDDSGKERE